MAVEMVSKIQVITKLTKYVNILVYMHAHSLLHVIIFMYA